MLLRVLSSIVFLMFGFSSPRECLLCTLLTVVDDCCWTPKITPLTVQELYTLIKEEVKDIFNWNTWSLTWFKVTMGRDGYFCIWRPREYNVKPAVGWDRGLVFGKHYYKLTYGAIISFHVVSERRERNSKRYLYLHVLWCTIAAGFLSEVVAVNQSIKVLEVNIISLMFFFRLSQSTELF